MMTDSHQANVNLDKPLDTRSEKVKSKSPNLKLFENVKSEWTPSLKKSKTILKLKKMLKVAAKHNKKRRV